jgi:hypothetical protein
MDWFLEEPGFRKAQAWPSLVSCFFSCHTPWPLPHTLLAALAHTSNSRSAWALHTCMKKVYTKRNRSRMAPDCCQRDLSEDQCSQGAYLCVHMCKLHLEV